MSIPIEKIKYGTRVVITDVPRDDDWYPRREKLLGLIGTIVEHKTVADYPIRVDENGRFACTISFDDGPLTQFPPFFRAVKFRLATDEEIARAEQKKAESKTPDLSCAELEFLVVLESARKWFMLREHPEWSNEDYFKRFPKDPKLYKMPGITTLNNCSCCSLWMKKCGNGTTNCPLDKEGLWCDSGSNNFHMKYSSGRISPWRTWRLGYSRRNAADTIFRAMMAWLVEHKR